MPLSGKEILKLYEKNGWHAARQKGSHVSVRKGPHRETIPMHKELDVGTEHKLLKTLRRT
jgi:predicted RNA binding protein YcfA (HicA-like mRNA interferase family)